MSLALTFSPVARVAPVAAAPAHDESEDGEHEHGEHPAADPAHPVLGRDEPNEPGHAPPPLATAPLPPGVIRLDPRKHDLQLAATGLTVVDYSAAWCQPCAELTPRLIVLLARHPRVALRIADVSDGESALAQGEFGKQTYALPLVTIFDANGRKLKTLSGSPASILAQLSELLTHY